ncbi:MAG: hypothetical protein ABS36_17065 [Acidobacteria bacterium SCN 69-37]|nr:MAG: hypothetical protein ABS36_17065 [Acidobacteria bacterium SCN 69-37]
MTRPSTPRPPRRLYIDWLRGFAVLCMVLWHVTDSWAVTTGRDTTAFAVVVFFAGWAAPMFLFLAGLSLPFSAAAQMARGRTRDEAARALVRRGWMVFLLAHLFRFQSFLLNPAASWNSLLKPDILNVLGLGLVMAAIAWWRATSARARVWWLLVPAVVVAVVLTPWAGDWWWPSLLHPRIEGYVRVAGGNAVFSLFPAVAYVLAGTFAGSLLTEIPMEREGPFLVRAALVGGAMVGLSMTPAVVPVPAELHRWLGPAALVVLRVGVMIVALAVVRGLLRRRSVNGTAGPMIVLGRASLIVYWVHVELAYGNVSYPLHHALSLPGALAGVLAMTVLMYGLARWWVSRPAGRPLVPAHMAATGYP